MIGNYEIEDGVRQTALKVVIYGPEGIGKSTLAAQFPNPVVIDIEGSTNQLDVARLPRPTSWSMLMDEVKAVRDNADQVSSLIIDTADAAEVLCVEHVIAKAGNDKIKSIEGFGYGKGYTMLAEGFGKLLNLLTEVQERGVNAVIVAHSQMRKFERPDEMGAYDRFELKLTKKVAPLPKEWADMVLFCDYKTYVTMVDEKGSKAKASGGQRVIRTTHKPTWDAKNRFGLKDPLPLEFASIATVVPDFHPKGRNHQPQVQAQQPQGKAKPQPQVQGDAPLPDHVRQLMDLLKSSGVTVDEFRNAVTRRGYFPAECQLEGYPADFIQWVMAHWDSFMEAIEQMRDEEIPFQEATDDRHTHTL